MKNSLVEKLQILALLSIPFLLLAVFAGGLYLFLPRYHEPEALLLKSDLHSIYCVDDTAFILLPGAAVVAPPHFSYHSVCAALFASKKDKK